MATALVAFDELAPIRSFLKKLGGDRELVNGWTIRTAHRAKPSAAGKTTDHYWYDTHGQKFRSMKEIAAHFGLIDAPARAIGRCTPEQVDAKLFAGASEQGWSVIATQDGHNKYTSPDGRVFHRKDLALAWNPTDAASSSTGPPRKRTKPATLASGEPTHASNQERPAHNVCEAKPVCPISTGMARVRERLVQIRLEQYADQFDTLGFDDAAFLEQMDESALREVARLVGMKVGHAGRFAAWFPAPP